jgi:adenosylcobinamide-phosphate synthase
MATDAAWRTLIALAGGLALDALLGDPAVNWHPVRLLGRLAASSETAARRLFRCPAPASSSVPAALHPQSAARSRLAGAATWLIVTGTVASSAWAVCAAARAIHPLLGTTADIIVVWASIAPADLAAHAARVRRALAQDAAANTAAAAAGTASAEAGPLRGRAAVSMLVGRDTSALDSSGVARACVESVSESSVDGAAAPLFWAALLGPWAAFTYRAVNTMDSMFGHKNERYLHFGLVPARADDVANWLPARISSLLACASSPLVGGSARSGFRSFFRWRLAHESPNAGHPESAYAGALGIRLGGPSRYAEGIIQKPWLNPDGAETVPGDITRATRLMYIQTILSAGAFAALAAFVGMVF